MSRAFIRILLNILLFAGVFLLPWWFAALVSVVLLALFTAPEAVFAGMVMDALYSGSFSFVHSFGFFFTLLFILLAVLVWYIKRYVIMYGSL